MGSKHLRHDKKLPGECCAEDFGSEQISRYSLAVGENIGMWKPTNPEPPTTRTAPSVVSGFETMLGKPCGLY